MSAIQAFLMWVLCDLALVTAFIFVGVALAEEATIYDENWQVQERIRDGTIYDRD